MTIKRNIEKTTHLTLEEYNNNLSNAQPGQIASRIGELVVDIATNPDAPSVYIANVNGYLNALTANGGGGGSGLPGGPNNSIQFNNAGALDGSANLTWDGSNLSATAVQTDTFLYANGQPWDFGGNFLITSNISSVTAGQQLLVDGPDLTDPAYPRGIWTLFQAPQPTFAIASAVWSTTTNSTKNAYANFVAGQVNYSNLTLTFSTNGTFDVTAGDYVLIGSANIDATTLGITGSVATVSVANTAFDLASQTASSVTISSRLTVTGIGQQGPSSRTVFNTQPVAYSISGLSGGWTTAGVAFWDGTNNYAWGYSGVGTPISGNVSAANAVSARANIYVGTNRTGSVTGANSLASGTTELQANTYGTGLNGYGTNFSNATASFNQASAYYPFFTKITGSNAVPSFSDADTHGTANSAIGDTFSSGNVTTDYAWIAVPTRFTLPVSFQVFLPGFGWTDPFYAFEDGGNVTIYGETYHAYGFNGFSATATIRTSSLTP